MRDLAMEKQEKEHMTLPIYSKDPPYFTHRWWEL